MSCSHIYQEKVVLFQSCTGHPKGSGPQGQGGELPGYSTVGMTPIKVMRYESASGYMRDLLVRAVLWNNLPYEQQQWMVESGYVDPLPTPPVYVYQATHTDQPPNGDGFSDTDWGNGYSQIRATPADAVENILPWQSLEKWPIILKEGGDHPIYLQAKKQRQEKKDKKERAEKEAARIEAEKSQVLFDYEAKFRAQMGEASKHLKTKKATVTHAGTEGTTFTVEGYQVLHRDNGTSTGITIHSEMRGKEKVFFLTQEHTGMALSVGGGDGATPIKTLKSAVGAAYALSEIGDFDTVYNLSDLENMNVSEIKTFLSFLDANFRQ